MATELILVRHGETDANLRGVFCGRTDTPLTELGLRQAKAVALRLADEKDVAAVYASPLRRALTTAEVVARRLSLAPLIHDDLAELDFGDLEGCPVAELSTRYPVLAARLTDPADAAVAFPNGESPAGFFRRVHRAVTEITTRHQDQRLVVVAHGGVISCAAAALLDGDPRRWPSYQVRNCSLTRLRVTSQGATLVCLDDVVHLNGANGGTL